MKGFKEYLSKQAAANKVRVDRRLAKEAIRNAKIDPKWAEIVTACNRHEGDAHYFDGNFYAVAAFLHRWFPTKYRSTENAIAEISELVGEVNWLNRHVQPVKINRYVPYIESGDTPTYYIRSALYLNGRFAGSNRIIEYLYEEGTNLATKESPRKIRLDGNGSWTEIYLAKRPAWKRRNGL